jgi:hypothetical protein
MKIEIREGLGDVDWINLALCVGIYIYIYI